MGCMTTETPYTGDRLLTIAEVGEVVHLCAKSARALTDPDLTGDPLPYVRIGRKRLVRRSDLDAWIDRRYTSKPAAA